MWEGLYRNAIRQAGIRKHVQVGGKWVPTQGESGGGEAAGAETGSAAVRAAVEAQGGETKARQNVGESFKLKDRVVQQKKGLAALKRIGEKESASRMAAALTETKKKLESLPKLVHPESGKFSEVKGASGNFVSPSGDKVELWYQPSRTGVSFYAVSYTPKGGEPMEQRFPGPKAREDAEAFVDSTFQVRIKR